MTYMQFQQLQKKDQSNLVLSEGLFLNKRETSSYQITLYQLFSFCVELCLHKPTNTIVSCQPVLFN